MINWFKQEILSKKMNISNMHNSFENLFKYQEYMSTQMRSIVMGIKGRVKSFFLVFLEPYTDIFS